MTWPFLGAVGNTGLAPTAQANQLAATNQLLLAPRAAAQRRRYPQKIKNKIKKTNFYLFLENVVDCFKHS